MYFIRVKCMCYEFYLHEAVIKENTCICTYHVPLVSSIWNMVRSFSRLYWPWQFWKLWASSFVVYSQFYCLIFPHDYIQLMHQSWKSHRRNTVFFTLYLIRWYMILICPLTNDVQFDQLIKVLSVRFLSYKLIILFPSE